MGGASRAVGTQKTPCDHLRNQRAKASDAPRARKSDRHTVRAFFERSISFVCMPPAGCVSSIAIEDAIWRLEIVEIGHFALGRVKGAL